MGVEDAVGEDPGDEAAEAGAASGFRASSRGARPTAAKMPMILPKKDFREWMGVTGRRGLVKVA